MRLADKRILLGVSGGIAAYKSAELVRRLKDQGAEVRVVMTRSAKEFITPLTLQAVSGHPVADSLLDPAAEAGMGHIELAKWADLVLIAPASANLMARMAAGMADELLTTLCVATPAPVALAPAMNQQMYLNAATQANLKTLASRSILLWGPDSGSQACGDVGPGRSWIPWNWLSAAASNWPPSRCWRASDCCSLPDRPAKHWIRCATSATTARARWVTPSPAPPVRQGPK